MKEFLIVGAASVIGLILGCVSYRLSPTGRRTRAEIKRLRAEIAQREEEMRQATKRLDNAIEILKEKAP